MPRRTHKKQYRDVRGVPDQLKPKGRKRPRKWHRGPEQDALYLEAVERLA